MAIPNFADNETPGGTINGSNVNFTLANAPNPPANLELYANGIEQIQGTDYTLTGAAIAYATAPTAGDILRAFYRY